VNTLKLEKLVECILDADIDKVEGLVKEGITEGTDPSVLLKEGLIKGMDAVGENLRLEICSFRKCWPRP
jgi:methanogenic corrinoid protein MtbC1